LERDVTWKRKRRKSMLGRNIESLRSDRKRKRRRRGEGERSEDEEGGLIRPMIRRGLMTPTGIWISIFCYTAASSDLF